MGLSRALRSILSGSSSSGSRHGASASRLQSADRAQSRTETAGPPLVQHEPRSSRIGYTRNDVYRESIATSYLDDARKIVDLLDASIAAYDSHPEDYSRAVEIREYYKRLQDTIAQYYAATGTDSSVDLAFASRCTERVEERLSLLNHGISSEVARFRKEANEIAAAVAPGMDPIHVLALAGEANDLLLEVKLYRGSWASVISKAVESQLDILETMLTSLTELASGVDGRPWESHPVAVRQSERAASASSATSSDDGTYESHREALQGFAHNSSGTGHRVGAVQSLPTPETTKRRQYPPRPVVYAPGHAIPSRLRSEPNAGSSRESRDRDDVFPDLQVPAPQSGILSRSRTLDERAASARYLESPENREHAATSAAMEMFGQYAQHAADQSATSRSQGVDRDTVQPELQPARSFASTLYATKNARVGTVSDEGCVFQKSTVRGDGRCLFRSVARAYAVARGREIPGERLERESADDLRARAVAELKKHRSLLAQYYVIETDFARYTKKMSSPRTFGGEPELLMLAKILHLPIAVYIRTSDGYKQIQVYGRQYRGEPIRILYSDGLHYDALLLVGKR